MKKSQQRFQVVSYAVPSSGSMWVVIDTSVSSDVTGYYQKFCGSESEAIAACEHMNEQISVPKHPEATVDSGEE